MSLLRGAAAKHLDVVGQPDLTREASDSSAFVNCHKKKAHYVRVIIRAVVSHDMGVKLGH